MNERFFMVWCPDGTYPPRTRHSTEESARRAATRLASENPGKAFFVVATVGCALVPQPVIWIDHRGSEEAADEPAQLESAAN